MEYSRSTIQVIFLIWTCLSRCLTYEESSIHNQVPDIPLLADILKYVKPFIKSFQKTPTTVYNRATDRETTVDDVIDAKIKELKNYFKLGELATREAESKLEVEGNEETTIIEFVPKAQSSKHYIKINESESFLKKIKKYKKIRNKIKLALIKESVSNKTINIITNTIDELLANIAESQCPWGNESKQFRAKILSDFLSIFDPRENHCYFNGTILDVEECNIKFPQPERKIDPKLVEFFKNMFFGSSGTTRPPPNNTNTAPNNINTTMTMYSTFTDTVSNIIKDSVNISDKYTVKCTIIGKGNANEKNALRKEGCGNFRICAEECRQFLKDFYESLNNTAVSIFTNYAAMYARDVIADDVEEKNSVMTTIIGATDSVEKRVRKGFLKHTSKFKLDKDLHKAANVEAIKGFIRLTVKHIEKKLKKHLENDLRNLRARLLLAIKNDIEINLTVELTNLANDLEENICSYFATCDGEMYGTFRKRLDFRASEKNTKPQSIYVKVQLTLDDRLKDTIVKKLEHKDILRNNFKNGKVVVTRTTTRVPPLPTTVTENITSIEDSYQDNNI